MSSQPGVVSYKRSEPDPPEIAKMRTEASAEVAELWSSDVTDSFLIIACDGIFEEIDNKQAVALARAAFQKYGVDDVGAVAKSIIEWVMLKGGTDLCGNLMSGAPRHRRDVVPVTASARWRGVPGPSSAHRRDVVPVTASALMA